MKKLSLSWLGSHWFIGFSLLGLFIAHYVINDPLTELLRLKTFDVYQQIAPRVPDRATMIAETVIIDIDDASLREIGQWPWPRTVVADLVTRLTQLSVLATGFDVVFAEKDRTSPDMLVQSFRDLSPVAAAELEKLQSNEAVCAGAIAQGNVVLGQVGLHQPTDDMESLTRKVSFAALNGDPAPFLRQYQGIVRNLPELEAAAAGLGLFSTLPDEDGVYRRVALAERVGDMIYPSLSLEMLRVALGGKDDYLIRMDKDAGGIADVVVKTFDPKQPFIIPTDAHGRVWVHFAEYDLAPPIYVPAKDILLANTPEDVARVQKLVANKLAVVGTSAAGLKDIRPTPIDGKMPGVEVHLQLLETILSNAHLTRPLEVQIIEVAMIVIGSVLMIFLVPRLSAIYVLLFLLVQIALQVMIAWHYYTEKHQLLDASYPALAIATMFLVLGYLNYMREEKERRQVKHAFSHYVSPALLAELAADPTKLKLGGETKNITVLFCDIRGFTTISEQFDAHGLTQFINRFLTPMTNVLLDHKATIDKYMGDAIMAFWNAPLDVPDHPAHACRAALAMLVAVKDLNATLETQANAEGRRHIPINIGVGLNTDNCCVGNMGSDQRFDYSALGDGVNLGSRLEGQSKTYGVDTVLGPNTWAMVNDRFATIELDKIQVKGKTEPVHIYALLGDESLAATGAYQTLRERSQQALTAYRSRMWEEALALFAECATLFPNLQTLCELYQERIEEYQHTPPPDGWDGTYIATSK